MDNETVNISLINEVKKYPIIWRKSCLHRNRDTMDRDWQKIATKLGENKAAIKARWRNLRDVFKRETKKLHNQYGDNVSLEHYSGTWGYYKHLVFLGQNDWEEHDKRTEEEMNTDMLSNVADNFNEEVILSVDNVKIEPVEEREFEEVNTNSYAINNDRYLMKRKNSETLDSTGKIRKIVETFMNKEEQAFDADLYFLKSLLPFFKQLDPLKKLQVRTDIQKILINAMSPPEEKDHLLVSKSDEQLPNERT